jgi:hypothetical protein
MSCSDETVERVEELPASPDDVWDALDALFEDDDERLRVDIECVPGERLTFVWEGLDNEAPSYVEIELERSGVGTIVHIRETRCDGDALIRSISARAAARA